MTNPLSDDELAAMECERSKFERSWVRAGHSILAEGDECLAADDLEGACRRFLVAAYCFARAWRASDGVTARRDDYRSAFHYAVYAAEPLLPDGDWSGQSHSSSTSSG